MANIAETRWLERTILNEDWKTIRVEELSELPGPYAYYVGGAQVPISFVPQKWEFGRTYFAPPWRATPIWYPCLRIWVRPEDKPGDLPWWDFTSNRIIYPMFEMLKQEDITKSTITITPEYPPPRTIYHIEKEPLE